MKSQIKFSVIIPVLCFIVFPAGVAVTVPIGTAFTYQGRLIDANETADGLYDFQFRLYDDPNVGGQQGNTIDINDLEVIDGYFTVELDFGSDVFNGDARWLQISVMPGDSMGRMTVLSPRQEVTPTPYALQTRGIFVDNAGNVGIGTADPIARLHVSGGSILLDNSYGLFSMDSSFFLRRLLYLNDMDNVVLSNHAAGNIFLGTYTSPGSALVRMTVTPAGDVGIGTTNPSSKLHVNNGCITGSMCSDIRLKKNIIPLSSNDSILDRVMGLQAVTFEWKHRDDGRRQIGLIAQDVEEVFPEVVTTPDDGSCEKGLLATGLDAVLVEAIKELRQQVEQLRVQNEYLLQKLTALEVSK
jgi:hypothetical protein